MRLVVIESPLMGKPSERVPRWLRPLAERVLRERNRSYAMVCARECLERGDAPYASHLLFDQPGLLDDDNPLEREAGIAAGQAWSARGQERALFGDHGISAGMKLGSSNATRLMQAQTYDTIAGYQPLPLWRCALAVVLRALLARLYR